MRIKRDNPITKCKVSELEMMKGYLILDNDDNEQVLFINCDKEHCFIIQNYSNDDGLCCLHVSPDSTVKVIGKIDDLDLCNLKLSKVEFRKR